MRIKDLHIQHFRNIASAQVAFMAGVNVIYGWNAQGKTNLLEAVYLLVTGKSFRTNNDAEMIPWTVADYNGSVIRADIEKAAGDEQIVYFFNGRQRRISINHKPIERLAHLIGRLNAVLFTPTDLLLVRGSPTLRRRFLDIAISQVNPGYLNALQTYQLVLKNRNQLLKQINGREGSATQLDVYDEQLSQAGALIMDIRTNSLAEISRNAALHYAAIANSPEALDLQYLPDVASPDLQVPSVQTLAAALRASRAEDMRRLSTNRGPHRDDFQFTVQQHAARNFASQGQQRTAVLAIKLAEMDFLHSHTGEWPLLMLDDLMSELDENRRNALLSYLKPQVQTFITTTDYHTVTRHAPVQQLIQVTGGTVTTKSAD